MDASQPTVDRRAWGALAACLVVAALLIWWQPVLAWFFGAMVAYLVLRAISMVLAAKASMNDPEERLQKEQSAPAQGN